MPNVPIDWNRVQRRLISAAKIVPGMKSLEGVLNISINMEAVAETAEAVAETAQVASGREPLIHAFLWIGWLVMLGYSFGWLFWLALSSLLTLLQLGYAMYQVLRIWLDFCLLSTVKSISGIINFFTRRDVTALNHKKDLMLQSRTFQDYEKLNTLGEETGRKATEWREVRNITSNSPVS
jgi:hypothetical protein